MVSLDAVCLIASPLQTPSFGLILIAAFILIQVSSNGYISFERPPAFFGVPTFATSIIPLVAPLFANFDFRDTGSVYHRVSQDDYILNEAAKRIAAVNQDFASYRPTLCVIVTWVQAVLFSSTFQDTQVSTCLICHVWATSTNRSVLCSKLFKL